MTKVKFNTSIVFLGGESYMINEVAELEEKLAKQLAADGVVSIEVEEQPAKKATTKKTNKATESAE